MKNRNIYVDINQKYFQRYAHLTDEEFGKTVRKVLTSAESRSKIPLNDTVSPARADLEKCVRSRLDGPRQNRKRKEGVYSRTIRLYTGILGGFGRVTDAEIGRILRDIECYTIDGTLPAMTIKTKPLFKTIIGWIPYLVCSHIS